MLILPPSLRVYGWALDYLPQDTTVPDDQSNISSRDNIFDRERSVKKPNILKKAATRKKSKPRPTQVKAIDFAKTPTLSTFTLRTKLVKKGSRTEMVAETDSLSMQMRVYSPHEGKNGLHMCPYMDHSFVVLQGKARFYGPRGETWEITKNRGILVPSGAYYCFENSGDDVLVVLRAASLARHHGNPNLRLAVNGKHVDSHWPENLRPVDHVDSNQYFE
jgi:mannose-6-phosphate isomerase-like protein (cupin superfamily)